VRPRYRVRLFGGPLVFQMGAEGEREVGWKLRRSFQVLAFLAASPDLQASRDDLEEAVWPADGERTIDRNFHPTLSHLRRALDPGRRGTLPPPLLLRGGIYRLNPEIDWEIDLQEFNRRLAEGRELAAGGDERAAADTWQRAWRLYHGPFLHGYYEAWVVARREELQQAYLELLRDVGDLAVRLERTEDAVDAYRSLLLEDPLQERTHLAVMRLYAGQGRRDLVRRQYERLCTLLLDELGVEPLPETVQEYHRLMS
jgi:DNA-binding SARP family transcriptional activator